MKKRKWVFLPSDTEKNEHFAEMCHISPLVAGLLLNRGINTPEAVKNFLTSDLEELPSPFLLPDMKDAVDRIQAALAKGEKITVYGDYDADGVTSTAILVSHLKEAGAQVDYYIPDRIKEGYGLNLPALKTIYDSGTTLIITVDTGVTACEEVLQAGEWGLDIVITDHHECKGPLPQAVAVVNPKREDSVYPFGDLAGVGVAFKLICALKGESEEALYRYSGLVAIGTIADVMPLLAENRQIVKNGLVSLFKRPQVGIKALFHASGADVSREVSTTTIGFSVAPRLNAAGRVGNAGDAVDLLLCEDYKQAAALAEKLCEENQQRQRVESEIFKQAIDMLEVQCPAKKEKKILVLAGESWHHGVLGIVASKLLERYGRPVILFSLDGDMGKGSGRSVESVNLYEALTCCKAYLERFGGHELAAGVTIKRENVKDFEQAINAWIEEKVDPGDMIPSLRLEGELREKDICLKAAKEINALQPFGSANLLPVLFLQGAEIVDIVSMGNDKHQRFVARKGETQFTAVAFSLSSGECAFACGDRVDFAGTANINSFRDVESFQFIVSDIRLNETTHEEYVKQRELYAQYTALEVLTTQQYKLLYPNRACFAAIYRYVKQRAKTGEFTGNINGLDRKISHHAKDVALNYAKMMVCFDVLHELNILRYDLKEDTISVHIFDTAGKIDLATSGILRDIEKKAFS